MALSSSSPDYNVHTSSNVELSGSVLHKNGLFIQMNSLNSRPLTPTLLYICTTSRGTDHTSQWSHWPLIGWEWSRDLDTGLWLAESGLVTWILASDWLRVISWPVFWLFNDWSNHTSQRSPWPLELRVIRNFGFWIRRCITQKLLNNPYPTLPSDLRIDLTIGCSRVRG